MSPLERRYRSVLQLLPASHRAVWEEEMVATFLETMRTGEADLDEYLTEHGRPPTSEVLSVAALAVTLRLGGPSAPANAFVWGQAVRAAALVGLLANALLLPLALAQEAWIAADLPLPAAMQAALAMSPPAGIWARVDALVALLWLAAYLALVTGRPRVGRTVALINLLLIGASAGAMTVGVAFGELVRATQLLTLWCAVLLVALLVLALAAFHRQAPRVPRRPWLMALMVGTGLAPVAGILLLWQPPDRAWVDWPALLCGAWIAAALTRRVTGTVPSALALTLLAFPTLALRVVSLLDSALSGSAYLATLALSSSEALVVGVLALALLTRTVRRLPPVALPASGSASRS